MRRTATALALSLVLTATWATSANAAPVVIKFPHVVAENTPKGRMANKFRDLVHERVGADRVRVEVYPNSQLYTDENVVQAMRLGDVQLAAPALSKLSPFTDSLQLFDLPFLFEDVKAVECFQTSDKGQGLLASMADKGVTGLGYLHNGMKQLSASRPLRVPEDAKGLKFRVMSSDVLSAQFQALDAAPVQKPFAEVFTLLHTGAIDGQENSWSNIYSKQFHELQPYITESNHGYLGYLVVTSRRFWDSLPADVRPEVERALADALDYGNSLANRINAQHKQLIIDSGESEIIELTPRQRAWWVEVMKPVWEQFEKQIGPELVAAAAACRH